VGFEEYKTIRSNKVNYRIPMGYLLREVQYVRWKWKVNSWALSMVQKAWYLKIRIKNNSIQVIGFHS